MKKLVPVFAALSIPMVLAACGTNAMPATATKAPMVSLRLGLGAGAQTLGKQGLPTGGFAVMGAHLKVKVADSAGNTVTFANGVYAPAGDGDAFLTLNAANNFGTTVLLPKGQYTFETIGKDGVDEQNTTGTLLAYSKTALTTVDASTPNVRLSVHAVMDALNSDLTFAMPTDDVYTNDQLDLRLHVRTSSVGQTAFNVPTSDYSVGVYSAVNGQLSANSVSKLGASVLAIGQSSDPTLTVTVPVTAWVRDGGAETASQQTQTVTFTHKVISGVVSVDVTAPTGTVTTSSANLNANVTVKGTASDDTAVTEARLYDGTALVASTDVSEQGGSVSALSFPNGDMNWEASWTPMTAGTHTLTLIVNDAAGNETSVDQTATVEESVALEKQTGSWGYGEYLPLEANQDLWIKMDASALSNNDNYIYFYNESVSYVDPAYTDKTVMTVHSSYMGPELVSHGTLDYGTGFAGRYDRAGTYWIKIHNKTSNHVDFYLGVYNQDYYGI